MSSHSYTKNIQDTITVEDRPTNAAQLSKREDEAAKVLDTYSGPAEWTVEEEARLRRKIDYKLILMLSQAAIFGIRTELDLNVNQRYQFSAAIFYLGFIVGAYPAMLLAQRYGIERVASGIVTLWGACLILTVACRNWGGLFAQRFFLGMLESGVSPMFMLVVGSWYRKDEQSLRMTLWYSMVGFVVIFSPLINYGLGQVVSALSPWKYMYLVAGAITIAWGVLILFILPPDPIRARGFNERECYILVARLRSNNTGVRNTHFKADQALEALMDPKMWLLFFYALFGMITNGPLSTFLPIVINGFGFSTLNSLLLVMPAGFYGGSVTVLYGWICYRLSHKGLRLWIIFFSQMVTALGAILSWRLPRDSKVGLLISLYLLATMACGYGIAMGVQIANTSGYTKRTVCSSMLYVGYCLGNFIGPLIFVQKEQPSYPTGFIVTWVTAALAGFCILAYRLLCMLDNRQRDREGYSERFDHAFDDPTDMQKKQVRYIL